MKRMTALMLGFIALLIIVGGCSNANKPDVTLYMMTQEGVQQETLDQIEQWMKEQAGERFTFKAEGASEYNKDKLTIEVGIGKYELIILPKDDFEEYVDQHAFEALEGYVSMETFEEGVRTVEVTHRLPNVPGTPQTQTKTYTSLFGIPLQSTVMERELELFEESLYLVIVPRLQPPIERVEALQLIAEGEITS